MTWSTFDKLELDPLLEAALLTFVERGYHGASVREIAGRAGVTVPTLYYHYGNKQGLLLALLQSSMDDLADRTRAAFAEAGEDPLHQFVDLVDCHVRFSCHRPRVAWLDAEARYLDAEARAVYAVPRREAEQQLLDVVERGVGLGVFDTPWPVEATRALFGAIQSIATWYRPDGPLTPEEIAARHVGIGLEAVGADATQRKEGVERARGR